MILTTLSDYAKQKGISRARAYQLQSKLPTIDLPVYAIEANGNKIPLYKDNQVVTQTYVQQDKTELQHYLNDLNDAYIRAFMDHNVPEVTRINKMMQAIESILK